MKGVGLAVAVVLAVSACAQRSAETLEWSIDVGNRGTLTLNGTLPDGMPTETWLAGELLAETEDLEFVWDLANGVPAPVSTINGLEDCGDLQVEFDSWLAGANTASSFDSTIRQLGFAQHVVNRQAELGC